MRICGPTSSSSERTERRGRDGELPALCACISFASAMLSLTGGDAGAQGVGSSAASKAVRYCSELERVTELAISEDRFAAITGKAREGNFLETRLALPGWKDCSLYGLGTYTCDSPKDTRTARAAEAAQTATLREVKACLGDAWSEATNRSSQSYVILHHVGYPVSITLSTDETEQKQHVVRVIVFRRSN